MIARKRSCSASRIARLAGEQVAGQELQVLEVERRLALLRRGVLGGEEAEQLLEQVLVARRRQLESRLLDLLAGILEARGPRSLGPERSRDRSAPRASRADRALPAPKRAWFSVAPGSSSRHCAASRRAASASSRSRRLADLEHERPAGRAQGLEDAGQHLPQPRAVRRSRAAGAAPDRFAAQNAASARSNASPRITAPCSSSSSWKRGSIPTANGCARRSLAQKPWMVEIHAPSSSRASSGRPRVDERRPDPGAQLASRLARVGDHEHRVDVEPLLADGADEALDEDGGLARAGAGRDEDLAARLDRRDLLLVHQGRPTRHIVQRSHHEGHSPPFGSCATSPARIRRAAVSACPRAVSTCPQNCSSSR